MACIICMTGILNRQNEFSKREQYNLKLFFFITVGILFQAPIKH